MCPDFVVDFVENIKSWKVVRFGLHFEIMGEDENITTQQVVLTIDITTQQVVFTIVITTQQVVLTIDFTTQHIMLTIDFTTQQVVLTIDITTQQRRLRHLRNIAARNIVNRNGHQLLDTYFTLHLCDNEKIYKEFYRSEVIKNSLNPTWRSLDFGIMPDRLDTSVSCFVVKIWGGKEDAYQLLIEWKVYLDGLKYLGQQIHARNQNEIIFGLNDGYYGAPFEHKIWNEDILDLEKPVQFKLFYKLAAPSPWLFICSVMPGHQNAQKTNNLHVDQNCVRNSYDVFSLLRLVNTLQEKRQLPESFRV
ncbi:hypothetical protein A6R68_12978, partial [Neotoma lepida]